MPTSFNRKKNYDINILSSVQAWVKYSASIIIFFTIYRYLSLAVLAVRVKEVFFH